MPTRAQFYLAVKGHAAALAAILLMAILGYGFLLRAGHAPYSPFSDFVAHAIGSQTILYESVHHGHGLPWWRNDELSGTTGLTNPANAYLCPLNFLFFLKPPLEAIGPTLWLYFLVAGLVGYAAGCALEVGAWARLLIAAAMMFQFKLIVLAYAGWLVNFPGACLIPLLFAVILYAMRKPGLRATLLLGLSGGLCLCAGQFQILYYSVLLLVFLGALCAVVSMRGGESRAKTGTLITLIVGGVLAAGLSAFLLLPLALEASLISRGHSSYDFFLSGHALGLRHFLTFLHPEALGTPLNGSYPSAELWEDVAYFGVVPLALAVAGIVLGWRQELVRFLGAAFGLAVLVAWSSPLQRVLFEVMPAFRLFRLPMRFLFPASWFGIALAGLGLDEILRRWRGRIAPKRLALAAAALIALVAVEGSYYARRYITTVPHEGILPHSDYQRFFAGQPGVYRVVPLDRGAINYGWAAPMGLQLATGYESLNYLHYQAYSDLLRWGKLKAQGPRVWTDITMISRPDLLAALNARFLVSRRPVALPADMFFLAAKLKAQPVFEPYKGRSVSDLYIYEYRAALPRAFFVQRTIPADGPRAAVRLVEVTSLRGTAVVEAQAGPQTGRSNARDRVDIIEARGGFIDLRTASEAMRYLVISEVWHPGWSASLDGRNIPLFKTDVALMGASIPGGEHRLTLRFRPLGWRLGLGMTALSGVMIVTGFLLLTRPRQRSILNQACRLY